MEKNFEMNGKLKRKLDKRQFGVKKRRVAFMPFIERHHSPRFWMSYITILSDLAIWAVMIFLINTVGRIWDVLTIEFSPIYILGPILYFLLTPARGLYQLVGLNPVDEIRKVFQTLSMSMILLALTDFILMPTKDPNSPTLFLLAWMLLLTGLLFSRWMVRILLVRSGFWGEPAVIVTDDAQRAASVLRYFSQRQRLGIRPELVILENEVDAKEHLGNIPVGNLETLLADDLFAGSRGTLLIDVQAGYFLRNPIYQKKVTALFKQVLFLANFSWLDSASIAIRDFEGMVGFEAKANKLSPAQSTLKRIVDIVGALTLVFVSAPLWLWAMIAIKHDSPGPIFYIQKRIGKDGHPFDVLKFRTMVLNADKQLKEYLAKNPAAKDEWDTTQKLLNDPRITKSGKWIRKFSIDELPQLLNILKGDMSLVGPRPIVDEEIRRYQERFSAYKAVNPGLTGMWQVSGRSDTTYAERVGFDVYYVRNWSIWLDIYILLRTVWVVVMQIGAR